YGYDVLVRIGWWRQEYRATYREIHADLATQVRISVSHVGYLYQQVSLPLLACHERQHRAHLAQIAQQQGGLIVALDGLAPQGGEPQIWCIRELSSGAWQKYSYRQRHGIIGAKNGQALLKGCSYDHRCFTVSRRLPQGAADRTTTGLFGTDCPPSDQSPASGAARQDSVGTGD